MISNVYLSIVFLDEVLFIRYLPCACVSFRKPKSTFFSKFWLAWWLIRKKKILTAFNFRLLLFSLKVHSNHASVSPHSSVIACSYSKLVKIIPPTPYLPPWMNELKQKWWLWISIDPSSQATATLSRFFSPLFSRCLVSIHLTLPRHGKSIAIMFPLRSG